MLVNPTVAIDQKIDNPDSMVNKTNNELIILKNLNDLIPLKNLSTINLASISLGKSTNKDFENSLSNYAKVSHFQFNTFSSKRMISAMVDELN